MELANDLDSGFWIDELAKLADNNAAMSNAARAGQSTSTIMSLESSDKNENQQDEHGKLKLGKLVDISEPGQEEDIKFTVIEDNDDWDHSSPSETQSSSKDTIESWNMNENEDDTELTKVGSSNGSGKDDSSRQSVTISFEDIVKEEQQKIAQNNHRLQQSSFTVDNAGNYHSHSNIQQTAISLSEIMRNDFLPERERRKKNNYNTTNISCTLHDLLRGMKSPVIRAAMDEIQKEKRQLEAKEQSRSRPNSLNSLASFEALVQEHQSRTKRYNANAKEFVPTFAKYTYSK